LRDGRAGEAYICRRDALRRNETRYPHELNERKERPIQGKDEAEAAGECDQARAIRILGREDASGSDVLRAPAGGYAREGLARARVGERAGGVRLADAGGARARRHVRARAPHVDARCDGRGRGRCHHLEVRVDRGRGARGHGGRGTGRRRLDRDVDRWHAPGRRRGRSGNGDALEVSRSGGVAEERRGVDGGCDGDGHGTRVLGVGRRADRHHIGIGFVRHRARV
jgi:hypothetical protein